MCWREGITAKEIVRGGMGGTGKSWNRHEERVGIDCFVGEAGRNAGRYSLR